MSDVFKILGEQQPHDEHEERRVPVAPVSAAALGFCGYAGEIGGREWQTILAEFGGIGWNAGV